jgi:hypothetical protein
MSRHRVGFSFKRFSATSSVCAQQLLNGKISRGLLQSKERSAGTCPLAGIARTDTRRLRRLLAAFRVLPDLAAIDHSATIPV